MTLIIAARFSTFDAASQAAQRLMDAGVHEDALHVFYVNPPGAHDSYPLGGDQAADPGTRQAPGKAWGTAALLGAVGAVVGGVIVSAFAESFIPVLAGAGVGAYVGSLAGAMRGMDRRRASVQDAHRPPLKGEGRPAGVLLAVNTQGEREREIARILVEAGGQEVERAQGRWRAGKWEDFDPTRPPVPEPTATQQ
ncbi:hypothetical protein [Yanghanlia caeni]|uniref:Glycine zipper domain-containing protein n=1 Tax=Yanghanlia caeni TaxID=3064283 RepID=A0ABU1D5Z3_9BURK|nr:hypothetical protein [Alcaligenaceae bacterium LG-2]NGR06483.1 hypothetical protein [bacterium SGD-2]HZH57752.1 hypothetical protein [Burkholderiaceae bacterium]